MEVTKFTKKATFKQVIELKAENVNVSGYLTFMVCDDTKCLPPTDVEFEFNLVNPQKIILKITKLIFKILKNQI